MSISAPAEALVVERLDVELAGTPVLTGVSLHVRAGEVVAVVGANGVGKTTLLRTVVGLERCRSGSIRFQGRELTRLEPQAIVHAGVRLVPQGRQLFPNLSVLDNLRVGAFLLREPEAVRRRLEYVFERFPILSERRRQIVRTLSGGEQQMLAIGRALMGEPQLLILDEPSLALAPRLVDTIAEIVRRLSESGVSVLLVEQNVRLALSVAARGYAMAGGRVLLEGDARTLATDPRLENVYLGGDLEGRHSSHPAPGTDRLGSCP
jgi:branched-chain amino acid transport system ATP-binding protein